MKTAMKEKATLASITRALVANASKAPTRAEVNGNVFRTASKVRDSLKKNHRFSKVVTVGATRVTV